MGDDRTGSVGRRPGAWVARWPTVVVVASSVATGLVLLAWTGVELLAPLPGEQVPGALTLVGAVVSVAGIAVCWMALPLRGTAAAGLAMSLIAWMLPALAAGTGVAPTTARLLLSTLGLGAWGCALVAAWGRLGPPVRSPLLMTAAAAVISCVMLNVGYDPFRDPACTASCPELHAPLADSLGPRPATGLWAAAVVVACVASLEVARRARLSPRTVRAAGALSAVLVSVAALIPWWRWGADEPTPVADQLMGAGVAVLSVAVASVSLGMRRTRAAVQDLVDQLEDPGRGGSRSGVAEVHVRVPGEDRWVGVRGEDVPEPSGPVLVLPEGEDPVARLVLAPRADADDVRRALTPAARLALDNARLTTLGRVRLQEVQSSQRRLVVAADAERARIERDLHDGTQQRLVAAEMRLRLAASLVDAVTADVLTQAAADVRSGLSALRYVSHGSYAGLLDDQGLAAAIEDVVGPAVILSIALTDERLVSRESRMAALVAVATLSAAAEASAHGELAVSLAQDESGLVVRAELPGVQLATPQDVADALTHAEDRVGAAGGTWRRLVDGTGTVVEVTLPCAS